MPPIPRSAEHRASRPQRQLHCEPGSTQGNVRHSGPPAGGTRLCRAAQTATVPRPNPGPPVPARCLPLPPEDPPLPGRVGLGSAVKACAPSSFSSSPHLRPPRSLADTQPWLLATSFPQHSTSSSDPAWVSSQLLVLLQLPPKADSETHRPE